MKHWILAFAALLAACGAPADRLTDQEAAAEQVATIEEPIAINTPSASPPPGPPTPVEYRAIGNEPGWTLRVTRLTMAYVGEYGSVKIVVPTPRTFRPQPGNYVRSDRLQLTIAPGPCSDGMSDLVYRHTVRLIADGKTVVGCGGGTVAPDALAGTNWTVTAINGRPTPKGAGYFLQFTSDEVSAKFGCNSIRGSYHINGDHVSTSDLVQTEMACPEPAMTFERLGNAVLASNMRTEPISGERLRLISEAGSIDLRRVI